ncbi:MAG: phosphomannomutase [Pseudomonadota bacterium]
MSIRIDCFKAYDVRGQVPAQLNADIAYRIGNATVQFLGAKKMVIGRDIRLSSKELSNAVADGITAAGAEVMDIGLSGTEMVYFSTDYLGADGGIMITASHNPVDYNGLKIVREQARPVSADSGLKVIRSLAESDDRFFAQKRGLHAPVNTFDAYIQHILGYVDVSRLEPLKLVVNPGNGGAAIALDGVRDALPFEFVELNYPPDGKFPNGIPNPMIIENQSVTADAVRNCGADMGIAWDGDFDRCFFFDENGRFIEGYYIVGLLAERMLETNPGAKIVHDPRVTWNTLDICSAAGGVPVQSKSGHSFIKETMREVDAVYGGEMSAHHYFRDFSYADSGMIPWLLVAELVSTSGKSLSELVTDRMKRFPASGERNLEVKDADAALDLLRSHYGPSALSVDETDGISFDFADWRFNVRKSNTEPVIRLNIESRGDVELVARMTEEALSLIS